jgi:hypothetical protein
MVLRSIDLAKLSIITTIRKLGEKWMTKIKICNT